MIVTRSNVIREFEDIFFEVKPIYVGLHAKFLMVASGYGSPKGFEM